MIHNGMQSTETQLFFLQESVLLVFFLSPWSLHSLPCGAPQASSKGSRVLQLFCPDGWWEHLGPGQSSCSVLPEQTWAPSLVWARQSGGARPAILTPYCLTPATEPLYSRWTPPPSSNWMKSIGFVVNLVVLEHVNHASGDLEVLRAGYGSQNSFRLQGMQPD